jgi:ABC-type transport system involved in cytochrome bd biosynthesis fused ATPase/permease subunit
MLELREVHAYYGNIHALKGLTLHVEKGEIVTLIGANGAGKSTTIRTITGLLHPRHGQISLEGERVDRLLAHQLVKRGVAQAPEGRRIFPRLSVLENLEMGAYTRTDFNAVRDDLERVLQLFPRLQERTSQLGGTLSGGEQQMLAIGRALMARWGWRRRWSKSSFKPFGRSTTRARPFCWSNKMPSWRSRWLSAATSSKPVVPCYTILPPISSRMRWSARCI